MGIYLHMLCINPDCPKNKKLVRVAADKVFIDVLKSKARKKNDTIFDEESGISFFQKEVVYETDDHYYMKVIRRGRWCLACGIVFETIEHATGRQYHKGTPNILAIEERLRKLGIENPKVKVMQNDLFEK